jgi:hypothetical protein
MLRRLKEELSSDAVDLIAVPVDQADDDKKLAAYAKEWKPASRLVNIAPAQRPDVVGVYGAVSRCNRVYRPFRS